MVIHTDTILPDDVVNPARSMPMSQMEMDDQETKSLWNSRLTWMAKHHPSALRELYRQGRLYEALSQNMTKAAMVVTQLTEKGMDPAEAERIALRDVVAPDASGMAKEEQEPAITEREMMEIEASLLVERRKRTSIG